MQGQGTLRLDTWLSKLLWAVATKQGGVLRVSALDLEDSPDRCAIVTDYDKEAHEIIIMAHSGVSSMIVINTEQQWAKQTTAAREPSQSSPDSQPTARSQQPRSDEELAALEDRLMQRAATRATQKRRAEEIEAMREL